MSSKEHINYIYVRMADICTVGSFKDQLCIYLHISVTGIVICIGKSHCDPDLVVITDV